MGENIECQWSGLKDERLLHEGRVLAELCEEVSARRQNG